MTIHYPEFHKLFLNIISGSEKSFKIDENEDFIVILDTAPVVKGHSLILPKRAILEWSEMTESEALSLHRMIQAMTIRLKNKLNCVGVSIMQNGGECNSISYLHVHLIPRFDTISIWKDDLFDSTPLADVQEFLT